ncbi:MAG: MFS transporter [Chloroflexi bacterium]|nr:MFS transporter [Chloroflexota bacterium]
MQSTQPVPVTKGRRRFYYGWVIVIVVGMAGFTQSAESYPVLSIFMKPITGEFGWSRTVFTGSTLVGTLIGGGLAVAIGPSLDRFGARWTMTAGFAIMGATLALMALMSTLWQFYTLQVIGRAVTMGVLALATSVVIPKWFITKRGRAAAIAGLGQRVGNTVTPLYVQFFVSIGSWRIAAVVAGVMMWVVSMLPAALFMRRQPEDMGMLPDGADPSQASKAGEETKSYSNASQGEVSLTVKEVLREPSFYLLMVAFSLAFVAAPALNLHMIPYMTDQGIDPGIAAIAVAILSACAGAGSLVSGFLAERFTTRRVMVGIFVLMGAGYFGLLAVHVAWQGIVWAMYYGFSIGGMFILQQVIFADYYGRESLGAIRGVVWPVQLVFNASGPFIASVAFDTLGSYTFIFNVFASLLLVSSLLIFLSRPPSLARQLS